MKSKIPAPVTRANLLASASFNAPWIASLIVGGAMLNPTASAVDNLWTGAADSDWNNPLNWSDPHAFGSTHVPNNGEGHPNDEDAVINTTTPNIAAITADISANPRDIKVGIATGATGQLNHRSGMAATGGSNWTQVGANGGTGVYNLADTNASGGVLTGFGTGSGSLTTWQLRVGQDGGANGGGNMAVNTSGTLTVGNDIFVGINGSGVINMDAGTLNRTGGWMAVGVGGPTGNGTFNMSGGTATGANETVVGLNTGSQGFFNLSGGTYTAGGLIQIGRAGSTGTVTVSGTNTLLEAQAQIWIGEEPGGTGTMTVSAGTVNVSSWIAIARNGSNGSLTISGTGVVNQGINDAASRLSITNFGQPTTGSVNLDGGTLSTRGIINEAGGTTDLNLNGGLLKPRANNDNFIVNLTSANVEAGGARIDTDGFNITVNQPLLGGAGDGGLIKSGGGVLNLNGANTYTGATLVNAGTLGGNGSIAGAVTVAAGAQLNPGVTTGVLAADSATIAAGGSLVIDFDDDAPVAADRLNVTGNLSIAGATLDPTGTPTSRVYILATYGTRTGTFVPPTLPPGYSLNYSLGGNQIAITRAATAFDNFIDPLFPANPNDPAFVGPNADPDQDGNSNTVEFALGGDPADGSDRPKVYTLVADSNDAGTARELLLTIAVRNGGDGVGGAPVFTPVSGGSPTATVDGVTYTIEGSTDLASFSSPVSVVGTIATDLPPAPSGYEYRTFRLDASDGLGSRGFLRVNITP